MMKFIVINIASLLLFCNGFSQHKNEYAVRKTFHIASGGGWDYIAVNNNKIYVSHATQVNILDEQTGDSIGIIPNTTGVHGIAFDNKLNKGFTSNGQLNNVTVFDLSTNNIITQIPTGENPDAITYEPFSKKIITCNGRSKNLSVIDPLTYKVIATIALDGTPEETASNNTGKLFVNLEDKNQIAIVNLKTYKVEFRFSLEPGESPTGLKMDIKTNRLFAGCDKLLIVADAGSGKVVAKLPIGKGCDGVEFDAKNKLIFTSNGEGNVTVIKENNANDFKIIETVPSKPGARTITLDEKNHILFLPAAEYEPADPKDPKARRKPIPGTFQILLINKK